MKLVYDFQILNDALLSMGAVVSVAELQGMYCGQISGGRERSADEWVHQGRAFSDLEHFEKTLGQRDLMRFIVDNAETDLAKDDFSFSPLLPDDLCPLSDRARELGAWCRGFLHGFGASGINKDTQLSSEVAEVLRDMAQISQAVKAVEDEEGGENDWYELVEYLRAAVFTVYSEMRDERDEASDTSDSSTVH